MATNSGTTNIYDQLVGDEGIKFNVTFDMIDMVIMFAGIFSAVTVGVVLANRINKALD